MPALKRWTIHDLVLLQVDTSLPWLPAYERMMRDVLREGEPSLAEGAPSVSVHRAKRLSQQGTRELEPGLRVSPSAIVDTRYGVRFEVEGERHIAITCTDSAVEWLEWSLLLALLAAGKAIVHGACLEKNGQAVILPSWGGVGKTAIVARFTESFGWRFLGDDLCMVDDQGGVLGFPKPMVLYPYHKDVFPGVFASGKGPIAPSFANGLLDRVGNQVKPLLRKVPGLLHAARRFNPQSVRIPPSDVFPASARANSGQLAAVIWLDRVVGTEQSVFEPHQTTLASRVVGSTINEYDRRCVRATNTAMGLGLISFSHYLQRWYDTLDACFTRVPQSIMHIPATLPVTDLPFQLREHAEAAIAGVS